MITAERDFYFPVLKYIDPLGIPSVSPFPGCFCREEANRVLAWAMCQVPPGSSHVSGLVTTDFDAF